MIPIGIAGSDLGFALRATPSHSGDKGDGGLNTTLAVHTTGAGFWQEGLGTLRAREQDSHENLLCMSTGQAGAEIGIGTTLNCNHEAPILIQDGRGMDKKQNGKGFSEDGTAYTLDGVSQQAVAFGLNWQSGVGLQYDEEQCGTLIKNQVHAVHAVHASVRRLTPIECERLQGFPDNYTNIHWGKKECPDGPRYKALGNSMAVPVMHWLGQRIQAVGNIQ